MNLQQETEWWDSNEAVEEYAGDLYLHNGEKFLFDSYYAEGLQGKRVLDLACGAGRTTIFLHEQGGVVVGTDISKNLIRTAHQRFPFLPFQVGDAAYLEFDDESFDVVLFSANSLDYLYPKDKRSRSIQEVHRVLRQGGTFIFSHHNLGAVVFGWYKNLRPSKLLYRLRHILNGTVFKRECYLKKKGDNGMLATYYAWSGHVIEDMARRGFELGGIYPNCPLLGSFQRSLRTQWLTRLADPWPYYVFQKK